jgi:hypothetical protein
VFLADRSEPDSDYSVIRLVFDSLNEPNVLATVDEFDSAVGSDHQMVGDVTNRWRTAGVAPDDEEDLMLAGCQTDRTCLIGTPLQESP